MFAITDLASIQEEHSIQLPHGSADWERRENGVTPPATQAQRVGGSQESPRGGGVVVTVASKPLILRSGKVGNHRQVRDYQD